MGLLTNKFGRDELKPGDHIYTYRSLYTYSHHGIFVGGSKVIHFSPEEDPSLSTSRFSTSSDYSMSRSVSSMSRSDSSMSRCNSSMSRSVSSTSRCDSSMSRSVSSTSRCDSSMSRSESPMSRSVSLMTRSVSLMTRSVSSCLTYPECGFRQSNSDVVISCLNCFLQSGSLYRYNYGESTWVFLAKIRGGTCTTAISDSPETVIHRATYLLQHGFGKYDVCFNNCEDFALYCKTGLVDKKKRHRSTMSGQTSALGAASVASCMIPLITNPVTAATASVGTYCFSRYATDIGVRKGVIKVAVEDLAKTRGRETHPHQLFQARRQCI